MSGRSSGGRSNVGVAQLSVAQMSGRSSVGAQMSTLKCRALKRRLIGLLPSIWLDDSSQENSLDSLRIQTLFREINNDNYLFFDRSDKFLFEIEKLTMKHIKLLVVMSESLVKEVLPKINKDITIIMDR
ncbi:unnamed protein product [Didymodactylos carnosus]|uniref:Uncharacterized protein n=1 Tax=Didymodactylos carnosus TaxID=1234261 RepID=A0A8S2FIS1_9BILA|nr:unnamed protein product [Didymodactylos carnosus]CAF4270377.1 unnamed protein product [Didymodactylos carnosus]